MMGEWENMMQGWDGDKIREAGWDGDKYLSRCHGVSLCAVVFSFETWFDVAFLEHVDDAHEQLIREEQRKHTLSMLHQVSQ